MLVSSECRAQPSQVMRRDWWGERTSEPVGREDGLSAHLWVSWKHFPYLCDSATTHIVRSETTCVGLLGFWKSEPWMIGIPKRWQNLSAPLQDLASFWCGIWPVWHWQVLSGLSCPGWSSCFQSCFTCPVLSAVLETMPRIWR